MKFAAQHALFETRAIASAKATLISEGFSEVACQRAISNGVSWWQLVTLALQFMKDYGPQVIQVIGDVAAVLAAAKTNPAGLLAALQALALKDGPAVYQIAIALAAMLGVTLPTLPTLGGITGQ